MRKIFKTLLVLILTVFFNTVFGYSGEIENRTSTGEISDDKKTIVELNNEVKDLKVSDRGVKAKIIELKNEVNINDFFRNDLSKKEVEKLKYLMSIYYNTKDSLDLKLKQESKKLGETEDIKEDLLKNKKDIYKELVAYIDPSKTKEYLDFIKKDIDVLKEKNDITEIRIKKNIILNEKVDFIKGKIIEHEKDFSKKLKQVISKKVDLMLRKFEFNDKFQKLDKKNKEIVLKNILEKTDSKIKELENIESKTSVLITKIEIYITLQENLTNMIEKIKES